jgi:hypothetical protein
VKGFGCAASGTRISREAASSHGAGSSEIVLTVDAEVTQRNFSLGGVCATVVQRAQCSQPSEVGAEAAAEKKPKSGAEISTTTDESQ